MIKKTIYTRPVLPKIGAIRLLVGLAAGISFAFSIYGFLVVCREAIRLLSVSNYGDVWILSDAEVRFYNFFYALIALIFGQSLILQTWFFSLRKPFEKRQYLHQSILNDQRNLNAFFIHWFTRMALILGFLFGIIQAYTLKSSSLYPEYNFLFILFAAVLFLQTWTTIRRKYKKGVLRWMAVSATLIIGISFAFSRMNIIDYKKLNEIVLNKNISYVYQIDYPVCEYFNRIERQNLVEDLYLIAPKSKRDKLMLIYQDKKYLLSELFDIKTKVNSNHSEYDRPYLTYRLHIDRKTLMKYVYQLTDSLSGYGMNRIGYVVSTLQPKQTNPNNVLLMRLPFLISPEYYRKSGEPPMPSIIPTNLRQFSNRIIVEYDKISKGILVNGKNIEERKLTTCLKENIEHDFNYACFICKNDNQTYESFIAVISHLMEAVNILRNVESQKCFQSNFDELRNSENEYQIRKQIPFHVFHLNKAANDSLGFCHCF